MKRPQTGVELGSVIKDKTDSLIDSIKDLGLEEQIEYLNKIRESLHKAGPFKNHPTDYTMWVKNDSVKGNTYNPNVVAPPEMELLRHSINSDGYTQSIVTWQHDNEIEVIDGFHRHRVGKECEEVKKSVHGYLPVVIIKEDREDKNNRIASTIRHNRARGKHTVDSMSDIILELKNRNWKNSRIARELGMEEDEILRLCQITGLADVFSDDEFSKSWEVDNSEDPSFIPLDEFEDFEEEETCKVVNTDDERRIFHTHDKWECYKAGFFNTTADNMTKDQAEQAYANFLSDTDLFSNALEHVITEWKNSCEHYLTNFSMNRIAWLGQASMCYGTGVPSKYCGGFNLLSEKDQEKANRTALIYLNKWLEANGHDQATMDDAMPTRQSTIY